MKSHILFPALVAVMSASACSTSAQEVEGLWYGALQPDDGAPVNIALSAADLEAASGTQISVDLPEGGVFTSVAPEEGAPFKGFYIQPGNQVGGQRLSHPVTLSATDAGAWSGTAAPLARGFQLYMSIAQGDDGELQATFMNPERNITGPARQYALQDDGESRLALIEPNSGSPFSALSFDEPGQAVLSSFGPIENFAFEAASADKDKSAAFFGEATARTLSVPATGAGLPIAAPESVGFDAAQLSALVSGIASSSADEARPSLIHSLLVAKDGQLVVEEYFRGAERNVPHDIRSAGKTFASVLLGALIEQGYKLSADTPVSDYIAVPSETEDKPITLGHLLTHQSGLDCYDGNNQSPGNEDNMWQQQDTENLWQFIADLEAVAEPGARYAYCSGGMNLVGAALAGATEQSVLSLLQAHLFDPLGFEQAYWNVMPNGEAYLGGGAYLRALDMLKIGQLYLDEGQWQGEQIIDRAWAKTSVLSKVEITPETTGLTEEGFGQFYFGGEDGYSWHRHPIIVGDKTYQSYEASGNGGQLVVVVPELNIVATMTGGNYGQGYIWGRWRQQIIGEGVIAALAER